MNTKQIERSRADALRIGRCYLCLSVILMVSGIGANLFFVKVVPFHGSPIYSSAVLITVVLAFTKTGHAFLRQHIRMRERVYQLDRFIWVVENARPKQEIEKCLEEWKDLTATEVAPRREGHLVRLLQQIGSLLSLHRGGPLPAYSVAAVEDARQKDHSA